MIALSDVIERFGADDLARLQPLPSQRRALAALQRCRTRLAATFTAQCTNEHCQARRVVPHSCGHRHCPHCQYLQSQRWIERQQQQLVPGPYFLVTFTLPAELRPLAWAHQRIVYDALMDCAWQTLREFAHNHRQLRGCPGAVAVLHTHSRALGFHPCTWPCPRRPSIPSAGCGGDCAPSRATCSTTRPWPRCFAASCSTS